MSCSAGGACDCGGACSKPKAIPAQYAPRSSPPGSSYMAQLGLYSPMPTASSYAPTYAPTVCSLTLNSRPSPGPSHDHGHTHPAGDPVYGAASGCRPGETLAQCNARNLAEDELRRQAQRRASGGTSTGGGITDAQAGVIGGAITSGVGAISSELERQHQERQTQLETERDIALSRLARSQGTETGGGAPASSSSSGGASSGGGGGLAVAIGLGLALVLSKMGKR